MARAVKPRAVAAGVKAKGRTGQRLPAEARNAGVVVDSAPLIYLLYGHAVFASFFERLFQTHQQGLLRIGLSIIALAEVLAGPLRHRQDALARSYENALAEFEPMPVTREIAVLAARLRAGTGLRLPEALQAATALESGAVALAKHNRDFSKLKGLKVLMGN